MCGIAGFHLPLRSGIALPEARMLVERMLETLVHRGPDADGLWVDTAGRCVLGHRRLSIIDTSPAGRQPMSGDGGRRWIAFNGEIYNFLELRPQLEAAGTVFRGRTDTEVLIEALAHWDTEALQRLDGMFALAAFDTLSGELLLARDPFGEKPLYTLDLPGGGLAFASELQALEILPQFDPEVSLDAVGELLMFQYIGAPRTIYRTARKLAPGHWMRRSADAESATGRYFEFAPHGRESAPRPLAELADEAEEILVHGIRRRMISDVPLGAFLSGGVDSSTVCALVRRRLGLPLQTFSIGFEGAIDSEHEAARRFAAHLGTEHRNRIVDPSTSGFLRDIGSLLDEPNGDSSCLPTYLLSGVAREHVTVAVSGDGGDEMFGGYDRYLHTLARARRGGSRWRAGDFYYGAPILVALEPDVEALLGFMPEGTAAQLAALRGEIAAATAPLFCRLRQTDVANYLPGAVLAKVDRMSMRHSLEVRTPFLNVELARFCEGLPYETLYRNGRGKLLLREIAKRYLPADLIDAPKKGFGIPMSRWAQDELLRVGEELLADPASRLRAALGASALDAFLAAQRRRGGFSAYRLWAVAVLESWLRHHPARMPMIRRTATVSRTRTAHTLLWNLGVYYRAHGPARTALRISQRFAESLVQPITTRVRVRADQALIHELQQRIARLDADRTVPVLRRGDRFLLLMHSLAAGGAQRQWCYLAQGLRELGYDVEFVVIERPWGELGHYRDYLQSLDIRPTVLRSHDPGEGPVSPVRAEDRRIARLLDNSLLRGDALRLVELLRRAQPAAIFAALDYPNLLAGVAGTIARVPSIVLSFRNYNPSRFSYMPHRSYLPLYRAVCASRRVHLTGNSPHANADYAAWLGIEPARIAFVPNAITAALFPPPSGDAVTQARRALGLAPDAQILLGVFRLSEEKQPELFVEICARLAARFPRARFLHCGSGPMEYIVRRRITERGLQDRLCLLGARHDVPVLMKLADLMLLTSTLEGMPNVLMEAQFSGLPAVATLAGAADECIAHGETGFVLGSGDVEGLTAACASLMEDKALAARMGQAAARRAREAFSPERMVRGFLDATTLVRDADG